MYLKKVLISRLHNKTLKFSNHSLKIWHSINPDHPWFKSVQTSKMLSSSTKVNSLCMEICIRATHYQVLHKDLLFKITTQRDKEPEISRMRKFSRDWSRIRVLSSHKGMPRFKEGENSAKIKSSSIFWSMMKRLGLVRNTRVRVPKVGSWNLRENLRKSTVTRKKK